MNKNLPDVNQFVSGGGTGKRNKKNMTIAIAAVALTGVFLLGAVGYSFINTETTESQHEEQTVYTSADEALTDSVRGYVNYALSGGTEVLSDEAAEELIAQITTGVLNSLPETMLQDEETVENLRALISQAVTEEIMSNNELAQSTEGYVVSTALSKDMLYYIDNVVVPILTAELEMDYGNVDELKETLAATSEEYNSNKAEYDAIINNITNRLNTIATNGASESDLVVIHNELSKLENVLTQYKSSTAVQITSIETELLLAQQNLQKYISELAERTTEIEEYTKTEISNVKEIMLEQLSQNSSLTTKEISELKSIIMNMDITNASNIDDIKKQLADAIANSSLEQSDALDAAVGSMNLVLDSLQASIDELQGQIREQGRLTDTELDALKNTLTQQIERNAALSDAERQQLAEAIANLDNSTASDLTAVKNYLLAQLGDTNTNITSAVDSLNADLTSIRNQIEANKNALDAKDTDLQNQIDTLNGSLGFGGDGTNNITIIEQITNLENQLGDWWLVLKDDGHLWAVQYADDGQEVVAKKLTFAQ